MLVALTLTAALSISLAVLSVTNLEWEDRISISKGCGLFLLGCVFFTALYILIYNAVLRTAAGQKLIKKYKMTVSDVLDISNKLVSAVQALLSCLAGSVVSLYSCRRNVLRTSHYACEGYAWFGAAYFFYDIWSMYKVYSSSLSHSHMNGDVKAVNSTGRKFLRYLKLNPVIVGHHIFIGLFGFLVITYLRGGLGDCVFGLIYLMEASTPFVSLRGIISRFGMKSSRLYVVNGMVMLGTFFIFRVAMFPYSIYLYAKAAGLDYISAIVSLPRGCKVGISILLFPQVYWFLLMLKGATQLLRSKKPPTSTANVRKRRLHNNSLT